MAHETGREAAEGRIARLRAEIGASSSAPRQALLHHEIGHILERDVGRDALAVKEYLAAYNLDPSLRPSLHALVRIFERRRSFKNLGRLYQAEAKSARSERERASALIDLAVLLEDHLERPAEAETCYGQALATDPSNLAAAILLERRAYGTKDHEAIERALDARAAATSDPVMRAMVIGDLAHAREARGDVAGSLEAIRSGYDITEGRDIVLQQMERIARRHGRVAELVEALEALADELSATAAQTSTAGPTLDAAVSLPGAQGIGAEAGNSPDPAVPASDPEGAGPLASNQGMAASPADATIDSTGTGSNWEDDLLFDADPTDIGPRASDPKQGPDGPEAPEAFGTASPSPESSSPAGDSPVLGSPAPSQVPPSGATVVRAAALLVEAARLRTVHLGDAAGAHGSLQRAVALDPNDPYLRHELMLTAELVGDLDLASSTARWLLDAADGGPGRAALHFRLAERAQGLGDAQAARQALEGALAEDPESIGAFAMLEDLLFDGNDHEARIALLRQHAQHLDGPQKALCLWRAARIAADAPLEFASADDLFVAAMAAVTSPAPQDDDGDAVVAAAGSSAARTLAAIARDRYAASLRHGAHEAARRAAEKLLALDLTPSEQSTIAHELLHLLRNVIFDAAAADELLAQCLDDEACATWAPDAARLHGAMTDNAELLARGHERLAELAVEADTKAAHRCAAARALLAVSGTERAEIHLRAAITLAPGHGYAVALLEEILRDRGEADGVVALLRESANAQAGDRALELSLLLAGAAAEATGDHRAAISAYEEAAQANPSAVAPLWAIRKLALHDGDDDGATRALEQLAQREAAANQIGLVTLDHGERQAWSKKKPDLAAAPLMAAMGVDGVGTAAAMAIALLPRQQAPKLAHLQAAQRLLAATDEGNQPALARWIACEADADGPDAAEVALSRLLAQRPDDPWGLWARIRSTHRDGDDGGANRSSDRADAWVSLAGSDDASAAADLLLHGLRAKLVAGGEDAADDAFILAQEVAAAAPDAAASAVALDETLAGGDDPDARVEALTARLAHGGREGREALEASLGRALVAARRGGALEQLRRVVRRDASDLASWEALRVAARDEAEWEDVVSACDRLAQHVTGDMKALLLEEAGTVAMDHLGDIAGASRRFAEVLDLDPRRDLSFGRLHDLLAERGDARALVDLVGRRIRDVNEGDELEQLFYEHARLQRAIGDLEGAAAALGNLLMLAPDHIGGLALQVEIHVAQQDWRAAVDALRTLALADVPAAQRRIAHLGAADILEDKLQDGAAALRELESLVEVGLADATMHARLGELAIRQGDFDRAAKALEAAAAATTGAERATHERRRGSMERDSRADSAAAAAAFRRALVAWPTDMEAARAWLDLVADPGEQLEVLATLEEAIRAELAADPTRADPLARLTQVALWRGDAGLELAVLDARSALGLLTMEEAERLERIREKQVNVPAGSLGNAGVARLRHPDDSGPLAEISTLAQESMAEVDRLDPAAYGVGKAELGKTQDTAASEVVGIARAFDAHDADIYCGGRDEELIAALPGKKGRHVWVLGREVRSPLDTDRRFTVAQLAMTLRAGNPSLLQRSAADGAGLLLALAVATGAADDGGRPQVAELSRALAKALPRRTRKALAPIFAETDLAPARLEGFCVAAQMSGLRAGLLVTARLSIALHALIGQQPTAEAVAARGTARDLVAFAISQDCILLRRELGLNP